MLIETTGAAVLHLSGGAQIFVTDKFHTHKSRKIVLNVDPGDTMFDVAKQIIVRWGGYSYRLTRSSSILLEEKTVGRYKLQSLETLYSTEIVRHDYSWWTDCD